MRSRGIEEELKSEPLIELPGARIREEKKKNTKSDTLTYKGVYRTEADVNRHISSTLDPFGSINGNQHSINRGA